MNAAASANSARPAMRAAPAGGLPAGGQSREGRLRPGAATAMRRVSLVAVAAALVLLALARIAGFEVSRAGHSGNSGLERIVIGKDALNVPGNVVRFSSQRRASGTERLDLYMHWPSLSGYSDDLVEVFNRQQVDPSIIFLTVEPRRMSRDMGERVAPLYSNFFTGEEQDAGGGLRKRRLSAEAGFLDEELYFEAGSSRPFATRCMREGAAIASPYCLRDLHFGSNLMVTYRFHRSLIGDWRRLDAAIRQRMAAMLAE